MPKAVMFGHKLITARPWILAISRFLVFNIFLGLVVTSRTAPSLAAGEASTEPSSSRAADSGIFGTLISAYGNPPAVGPKSSDCLTVYDSARTKVVAKGVCGGIYQAFRVPLPPGRYLVEFKAPGAAPLRRKVVIEKGKWVDFSAASSAPAQ